MQCNVAACGAHITVAPQNTAVIRGRTLTLRCATNTSTKLSWYFGQRQVKIFNGFNISPEFRARHATQPPSYDLVISDVRMSDAGLYTCLHSKTHSATALVVVLGERRYSLAPSFLHSPIPSVRPSVCLSVRPSVCLSVRLSVCLSVCLSVRERHYSLAPSFLHSPIPSVRPSVRPSVCLSVRHVMVL